MKTLPFLLLICGLAAVFISTSGCVQDQERRYVRGSYRSVPRSPYIGSPEWITWVDHKVDTRYANGIRPDPGTQEWYAIVDHVVFTDHNTDFYRGVYRNEYRDDYRNQYRNDSRTTTNRTDSSYRRNTNNAPNYYGPARFDSRYDGSQGGYRRDGKRYKLGTLAWKRAVDAEILTGRVPAPPPRSDPWDAPLAPTH